MMIADNDERHVAIQLNKMILFNYPKPIKFRMYRNFHVIEVQCLELDRNAWKRLRSTKSFEFDWVRISDCARLYFHFVDYSMQSLIEKQNHLNF